MATNDEVIAGNAPKTLTDALLGKLVQLEGTDGALVEFEPDAQNGKLAHLEVTLSATPETVTTITLPDWARGFRLYPTNGNCRFAIGQDPAALATSTATTITSGVFAVGGNAMVGMWETRTLVAGANRTLRLRSATASLAVRVGLF